MATVTGQVTMDGAPLENGIISYAPDGDEGEAITAEIVQGKYSLEVLPGKKIVQISAPKIIGQRPLGEGPNAPMSDITEEQLPAKYHANSELRYEVTPGVNSKDWSVERARRAPQR
jgi:hypothetical protein